MMIRKDKSKPYGIIAIAILLSGLVMLSGCGPHTIITDPHTFKPNYTPLPVLEEARRIGLSNAYLSKEVVDVTVRGPHWVGDLQAYTNSAITLLKEALQKSNITASGNPEKDMAIRIYDVDMVAGAWVIGATLKLDVKLPDGRTLTFEGQNRSPNGYRALDGAILRAVESVLADDVFLGFLDIDKGEDSNKL